MDPDGRKVYFAPGSSNEFKQRFKETVQFMNEKGSSFNLAKLEESSTVYYIREGEKNGFSFYKERNNENVITWNPYRAIMTDNDVLLSPITALAHELGHAAAYDKDKKSYLERKSEFDNEYGNKEERRVIEKTEQYAARVHGELMQNQITRENHSGILYKSFNKSWSVEDIVRYVYLHNASLIY